MGYYIQISFEDLIFAVKLLSLKKWLFFNQTAKSIRCFKLTSEWESTTNHFLLQSNKFFILRKIAHPRNMDSKAMKSLDDNARYFDACQQFCKEPLCHIVSHSSKNNLAIEDKLSLNISIIIDDATLLIMTTITTFPTVLNFFINIKLCFKNVHNWYG